MLKRFLREKYLLMVCLQNFFAIPFFYWHKSSKIFLGQYSLKFILLIILPYVSMILFIFLIHKGYIRFSKIKNQTSSILLPLKILFLIVGFFIAYILSTIKINYLGPIIFFCFISFFFSSAR